MKKNIFKKSNIMIDKESKIKAGDKRRSNKSGITELDCVKHIQIKEK